MHHNLQLGQKGEEIAVKHLLSLDYDIIERNWRYSRTEIDIIAIHRGLYIFVEVKTRSQTKYGTPEDIISEDKMNRMAVAAEEYLMQNEIESEIRFDIISIIIRDNKQELKHIEDAFFPYG